MWGFELGMGISRKRMILGLFEGVNSVLISIKMPIK